MYLRCIHPQGYSTANPQQVLPDQSIQPEHMHSIEIVVQHLLETCDTLLCRISIPARHLKPSSLSQKQICLFVLLACSGQYVLGVAGQVVSEHQGKLKALVNSANVCYVKVTDPAKQDSTTTALWRGGGVFFHRHYDGPVWSGGAPFAFGFSYFHARQLDHLSPLMLVKKDEAMTTLMNNGGWIFIEPDFLKPIRVNPTQNQTTTLSNPALTSTDLSTDVPPTQWGTAGAWQENPIDGSPPFVVQFFGKFSANSNNVTSLPVRVFEGREPNQSFFKPRRESVLTNLDVTRTSLKLSSYNPIDGTLKSVTSLSRLPRTYLYMHGPQTHATNDPDTVVTTFATGPTEDGPTYAINFAFTDKETGEIKYAGEIAGGSVDREPYYSHTTQQIGPESYLTTYRHEAYLWGVAFNKRGRLGTRFIINKNPIEEPGRALTSFFKTIPVTTGCSAWETPNNTVTSTRWDIEHPAPPVELDESYPQTTLTIPEPPLTPLVTTVTPRPQTSTTSAFFSTRAIAAGPPSGNAATVAASVTAVVLLVLIGVSMTLAYVFYRRRQHHLARTQRPVATTPGTEMGAAQSQTARPPSAAYSPAPHRAVSPPGYDSVPNRVTSSTGYDVAEAPLGGGHHYDNTQQPI
ncbi:MAG: hypothetical protein S4CHLAM2_18780 [Chlamydiales bacterium]|nr:hypothetical protein [Chlamydiales bacterium]